MPVETGIRWLDQAVASTGLPDLADFESARHMWNRATCGALGKEAFRKLPIPYRRVNGTRRYEVAHVFEDARRRILDAPLRKPALPVAVHRREAAGQRQLSEEEV